MRKLIGLFVCLLFATSLIVATGCAKKEEPAKPAEPAKTEGTATPAPEQKAGEATTPPAPDATPAKK